MKDYPNVGMPLIQLLQTQQRMLIGHLFTFYLADGSEAYFTDLDMPITYGGNTYVANSLRIQGMKLKLSVGFEVDEQEVSILASPSDTLNGDNFLEGCAIGLLDGAYLARDRAFWASQSGNAFLDFSQPPVGVARLFYGRVSTITALGRTQVKMKVKSPLILLNIEMPRNYYGSGCQWVLFSAGCTLDRSDYAVDYTVVSATAQNIFVESISTPTGADSLPYYQQGRILFTSGSNDNLETMIAGNGDDYFTLMYPLYDIPAVGDTFTAYPGCSKQMTTCNLKYSNLINFRGFPFVPQVLTSL